MKMTKQKERLYITELLEDPPMTYPMYYMLSAALVKNELLLESLKAVHLGDFENFTPPQNASELFGMIDSGVFAIYKGQYVVGNFGGKLMFLESSGWKSLGVTRDIFEMGFWLI